MRDDVISLNFLRHLFSIKVIQLGAELFANASNLLIDYPIILSFVTTRWVTWTKIGHDGQEEAPAPAAPRLQSESRVIKSTPRLEIWVCRCLPIFYACLHCLLSASLAVNRKKKTKSDQSCIGIAQNFEFKKYSKSCGVSKKTPPVNLTSKCVAQARSNVQSLRI